MRHNGRNIVIIGGGIAGLCAAVYALKCGYDVEVLERNDLAGGLAMSWRRGPYTFETCLHWLIGSKQGGEFHQQWREVFEIDRLRFVDPHEFVRIETEQGDSLHLYTNADLLEAELLRRAPKDLAAICDLTRMVRSFGKFRLLDPAGGLARNWLNMLRDLPIFPALGRVGRFSGEQFGGRFTDPLLRAFFSHGDMGKLSAIAMVLSLAWMNDGNAGYCIGGSQALIRLITERIAELGGRIRYQARAERIVVENNTAVGVQLAGGEMVPADWVISAADGHRTIFEMLGGRYVDQTIRHIYEKRETFASYLQVSLGVARDLSDEPPMVSRILDTPIRIDPETETSTVGFRIFNFDPTFAEPGKTAVTSLLPTRNFSYWTELRQRDIARYRAEKNRVAQEVIGVLDKRMPAIRSAVEVVDVSTPATVIRYTGNWKASQEGWLLEPGTGMRMLPTTLPGLKRFAMAGQWVLPGGGLPSGPITARPAIKAICRQDHVPFRVSEEPAAKRELVGA
jgi:phytoene dehydrogenase-like protein